MAIRDVKQAMKEMRAAQTKALRAWKKHLAPGTAIKYLDPVTSVIRNGVVDTHYGSFQMTVLYRYPGLQRVHNGDSVAGKRKRFEQKGEKLLHQPIVRMHRIHVDDVIDNTKEII